MHKIWSKHALTLKGWKSDVEVIIDDTGRIHSVSDGQAPSGERVDILLPSPANAHSHAFQRSMAGMTERRGPKAGDSFWTWRQLMFRFLDQLTPDHLQTISEFVQMEMLEAGYWADASYIAEQVLSVDELLAHVEANWPADRVVRTGESWLWLEPDATTGSLRHLLARRLARDGRWSEALPFYPDSLQPTVREIVEQARLAEDDLLPRDERGQALWAVARTLRDRGLELIGTEVDPDWYLWGADFDVGRFPRADAPAEETGRVEASLPVPPKRYHYRYVAAELGWSAALMMPDQSETTAEVLFTAGSWLKNLDPGRADRFYKALVRRCGRTPLGREADRRRWFPPLP